jgi:REP element-mobilizing transposase RayT
MREPCEGKLSCTVLRREGARKGSDLSDTVGNINEETILKYIKEQEENDKLER